MDFEPISHSSSQIISVTYGLTSYTYKFSNYLHTKHYLLFRMILYYVFTIAPYYFIVLYLYQ